MAPNALLVAFLKSRGKISEVAALSRLTRTEMDRAEQVQMKPQGSPATSGGGFPWAWLMVPELAVLLWLTHAAWWPQLKGLPPK